MLQKAPACRPTKDGIGQTRRNSNHCRSTIRGTASHWPTDETDKRDIDCISFPRTRKGGVSHSMIAKSERRSVEAVSPVVETLRGLLTRRGNKSSCAL